MLLAFGSIKASQSQVCKNLSISPQPMPVIFPQPIKEILPFCVCVCSGYTQEAQLLHLRPSCSGERGSTATPIDSQKHIYSIRAVFYLRQWRHKFLQRRRHCAELKYGWERTANHASTAMRCLSHFRCGDQMGQHYFRQFYERLFSQNVAEIELLFAVKTLVLITLV